ncbi:hypothetical protein [Liquorilactobacillus nagelii]|uniref:hypothetical protein n=1 Tax=Liquorilactobacillus nagelii TaxID=82688 RepID=UPI0006EFF411|nr:hypothetical protein [Liquorilactobacillus nagelii]KRL41813.1 hypothetical protein FD45_GL000665 [Liquorilactobacillus nagelii DSM 13675]QYH55289.1 hypothetical protein G6O73_11850 [Liquorilactobacillus nagelii DSM 13675]
MDEKVKINEDVFAAAVVEKHQLTQSDDLKKFSKECLRVYLEAFILAQDFNEYEDFNYKKSDKSLFESFMESMTSAQKSLNNNFDKH